MAEVTGATEEPTVLTKDQYLESIGEEKAELVTFTTEQLASGIERHGFEGFIMAVGGTVKKEDPHERGDVDLIIGINFPKGMINMEKTYEKYEQRYQKYKQIVMPLKKSLETEFGKEVSIDPTEPGRDYDHGEQVNNDGHFYITVEGRTPIDIICWQETELTKPMVKLHP